MKIKSPYLVKPHRKVRLSKIPSSDIGDFKSEDAAKALLAAHRTQLADLQDIFYASQSKALLIVLQGMDTAGKDGTIKHIFSGINPQVCDVAAFKVPTPLEARHDFRTVLDSLLPLFHGCRTEIGRVALQGGGAAGAWTIPCGLVSSAHHGQ